MEASLPWVWGIGKGLNGNILTLFAHFGLAE